MKCRGGSLANPRTPTQPPKEILAKIIFEAGKIGRQTWAWQPKNKSYWAGLKAHSVSPTHGHCHSRPVNQTGPVEFSQCGGLGTVKEGRREVGVVERAVRGLPHEQAR